MNKLKKFLTIIKRAAIAFYEDNAIKLSASLSYYMVFALCPLLIIVISLAGYMVGEEAVTGKVYGQLAGLLGNDAALQIQLIIENTASGQHGLLGAVIGFIVLFFAATGVFAEIQDSINFIWAVKAKPERGWLRFIINRLLSFSIIISMGFILMVTLMVNAVMEMLSDRLTVYFSKGSVYLLYISNLVAIFMVTTILFGAIFKILPDAKIRWRDAFIGAAFTSLLFLGGKFLIGYYLGNSRIGIVYGTAASIIIILLWVYYSSIILYFGAEFTRMYALSMGGGITPDRTAVFIIKKEAKEIPESHLET